MRHEIAFVALFVVATAVAILARHVKIPYTVALVAAGLGLGSTGLMSAPHLTKELLYTVFLPGLIFEAAYALEYRRFMQNKWTILSLALPGLVVSVGVTAALLTPAMSGLHVATGFGFLSALVFASVIAATDPIAVVSLFKSLGAPKRLSVLVEGESLLNDGTAAVFFLIVIDVATGTTLSVPGAALSFVRTVGLGLCIGAAVGLACTFVIQKIDDPMIEITVTTIAAYGSFVAAEYFHLSGVIATVAAGMLCGNYASRTGMSPSTRLAVSTFWEYLAFALNSIVFLLIGFEVRLAALLASLWPIVVAYVVVLLGRAIVVYVAAGLLGRTRERVPGRWAAVLTWGGLRGGLSMVLVLGLPPGMPHRELLVTMTFGVVVLSIMVQGTTMGPLLRWLGLVKHSEERATYDRLRGQLVASQAGLREVTRLQSDRVAAPAVLGAIREDLEKQLASTVEALQGVSTQASWLLEDERRGVLRATYVAQKDALADAMRRGRLLPESYEALLADVDAKLQGLEEDDT